MEFSNELKKLMESGETIEIRKISDDVLFEMLANYEICEANGKKGAAAFQDYFNTDMSYSNALKEPAKRGYQKYWCKDDSTYLVDTGAKVDSTLSANKITSKDDEVVVVPEMEEVLPFTMDNMIGILTGSINPPQRMYVRAYPETIKLLKSVCEKYAHGVKGIVEANILDDGVKAVVGKYDIKTRYQKNNKKNSEKESKKRFTEDSDAEEF